MFVNAAIDGSRFHAPIPLAPTPYFRVAAPCFDGFLMKADSWFCLVMRGRSRSLEGAGVWKEQGSGRSSGQSQRNDLETKTG